MVKGGLLARRRATRGAGRATSPAERHPLSERELSIDNLLVQIHLLIEMNLENWLCAMGM